VIWAKKRSSRVRSGARSLARAGKATAAAR
jgi:hypothetical protein